MDSVISVESHHQFLKSNGSSICSRIPVNWNFIAPNAVRNYRIKFSMESVQWTKSRVSLMIAGLMEP